MSAWWSRSSARPAPILLYLIVLTPDLQVMDVTDFGRMTWNEKDADWRQDATVGTDLAVTVKAPERYSSADKKWTPVGEPRSAKVSPLGLVGAPTIADGAAYQDPKSKEMLFVSQDGVRRLIAYRAGPNKPVKHMVVVTYDQPKGETVAEFAGAKGRYVLTQSEDAKSLTCRNPDGTTQRFERVPR
ncbi:MAG: hypothetical protein QM765_35615 [Myxococcales bacterium]